MVPTKTAQLAIAAVLGFRFGRPLARQLVGVIPGLPAGELGEDVAGAIAAAGAFLVAKRFLR